MKRVLIGLLAATASLRALAGEPQVSVVELADLSCERCASFASSAQRIADVVRKEGGVFRVAPVGPTDQSPPTPKLAVLVVHELNHRKSDETGQEAAGALYSGYAAGAELDTREGVASWLRMHGVDGADDLPANLMPANLPRFGKALMLARESGAKNLPALVFVSRSDGRVVGEVEWTESGAKLETDALDLWKKLTAEGGPNAGRN